MSSPQRRRRASLTAYLNSPTKWSSKEVALPSLPTADLQTAFNAQKYTPGNNDVLEFIGDRVVNLACALMAEKVKEIPDEQAWLARRLSNNDTLGRIAYQLRLHRHARLDPADRLVADSWTPARANPPPKLFADLYESYVGALYTHHGWTFTHAWLRRVYTPVLAAATRDVFFSTSDHVVPVLWLTPDALPWPCSMQRAFEAFIGSRRERLRKDANEAFELLPRVSVSQDAESTRVEIATQLLKLWICDVAQRVFPELRFATQGGAHFLTMVTSALMSDDTLGHISALLSLSSYLPPSDPHFLSSPIRPHRTTSDAASLTGSTTKNRTSPRTEVRKDASTAPRARLETDIPPDMAYRAKLARVLKVRIGAFCLRHPVQGRKWGRVWISPLVQWAMDALLARGGGKIGRRLKPKTNLPVPTSKDLELDQDKKDLGPKSLEDESERTLSALLSAFKDLDVGTARRRSNGGPPPESTLEPKSKTDGEAKNDTAGSNQVEPSSILSTSRPRTASKSKSKVPHTIKIKLAAGWTVTSATSADGLANAGKVINSAALDPYKLLDEGGAFPAPVTSDTPPEADDDTNTNPARTRDTDDEDSWTDMEFSLCDEESGSDMEFSSSSDDEDGNKAKAAVRGAAAAFQTAAEAETDALSEAVLQSLARLDLEPIPRLTVSVECTVAHHTVVGASSPSNPASALASSVSSADANRVSSKVLPLGRLDTNFQDSDVKFRPRKVTRPTHLRVKTLDVALDAKAEAAAVKE